MRLFKVRFKHYAPKDSEGGIVGFLLRETEKEVCDYVMTTLSYWDADDLEEETEVWDEDYENSETITKREELLRNHGQIELDSNDYSDAYYGITHHGWEDMGEATGTEVLVLRRMGLLIDDEKEEEA